MIRAALTAMVGLGLAWPMTSVLAQEDDQALSHPTPQQIPALAAPVDTEGTHIELPSPEDEPSARNEPAPDQGGGGADSQEPDDGAASDPKEPEATEARARPPSFAERRRAVASREALAALEPPVVPGFNPALPDGGVGRSPSRSGQACPEVPQSMRVSGDLRVQPGRTHMVVVSRKHLSRFVTPFQSPDAISNSQNHEVMTEGKTMLLSMPHDSCEPVGLFIFDRAGDPDLALNLTLWPQDVPQVDINLVLPEELVQARQLQVEQTNLAPPAWDHRTPHVDALTTIMKPMALGEVPPGFALRRLRGREAANQPVCMIPGASTVFRQILDSGRIHVYVAAVRNTQRSPLVIDEGRCASPGVQAVAAWPSPRLEPGGQAELFVIVDPEVGRRAPERSRPSVLE